MKTLLGLGGNVCLVIFVYMLMINYPDTVSTWMLGVSGSILIILAITENNDKN